MEKKFFWFSKQKEFEVNNRIFKLDPFVDAQVVLTVAGRIQTSLVQQEI